MDTPTIEAVLRHDFRLSATIMYTPSRDWEKKEKTQQYFPALEVVLVLRKELIELEKF